MEKSQELFARAIALRKQACRQAVPAALREVLTSQKAMTPVMARHRDRLVLMARDSEFNLFTTCEVEEALELIEILWDLDSSKW